MIAQEPREIRIGDGLARARIGIVVGTRDICHGCGGEAGGRRAVHARNRALGRARDADAVVNIRDRLCRIVRCAVIDLCHVSELDSQGTRRNRARIATRNRLRGENIRRPRRLVEGIVVRLDTCAAVKGRRIGHTLRGYTVVHTVPCDILRGVFRRRRIRARLVVDKAGERDERIAARDIAVAVGLVVHRVIDLRDVVVFDRRHQRLRCDLARAAYLERVRKRRIHAAYLDIVVTKLIHRRIVRIAIDIVGDARSIRHVLRIRSTGVREVRAARAKIKVDMSLVARDNARIARGGRM